MDIPNIRMKFLHYLIFINQHALTFFLNCVLLQEREILTPASWASSLLLSFFPFSSFIFLWMAHSNDLGWWREEHKLEILNLKIKVGLRYGHITKLPK